MACALSSLPVDLLPVIFAFLDGQSILRCSAVCREWHSMIESSTELLYVVELWADGLEAGYSLGRSPHEKLQRLLAWRQAWSTLDWSARTTFPISEHPRAYELVGGVFAQHNTWPRSDFSTIRLPSVDHRAEITARESVGVSSLDFAMDPTQDLVVFLYKQEFWSETGNFDIRSLSTLEPHPLAALPTLSFDLRDDAFRRIFLQVADDVIGLLFRTSQVSEGSLRLVLFNWRSGIPLLDLAGPQLPHSISDFALLSPRSYILASVNEASYLPGMPKGKGELHLYAFDGKRHYSDPDHVASFQLPSPHPNRILERIIVHSGPFCAGPIPGAQFIKSNERRICVISLAYDHSESYSLFVPHAYFEQSIRARDEKPPSTVPWEDWGPYNTRLLRGRHVFWLRYVHGERVVSPVDAAYPYRIEVLDFGFFPGRLQPQDQNINTQLHLNPSTISQYDTVFQEDVTTCLPYRRIVRDLDQRHILFLIDQDRIIGVNETVNQLTVYAF
ncbi:F-box domain-containing protein [Mycena indigotica]|uniref:F-box domain-containing protein n=1 Tax=Mycena indigotica TaxID=2126181 RepID=A0A8H6T801_9AGAR|nr:F-box domain-containing protein [Mycena indigotica]KAF7312606.1 F-box domain-containing protein [Mycena indigotica]